MSLYPDLPVLLEQLPSAIRSIEAGQPTDLEFYEQGIQRFVHLEPKGDGMYSATCASWTDWQPDPATEELSCGQIRDMLSAVLDEFMEGLRKMSPDLARHPWVLEWLKGIPLF